jgi:arabinose-5-phosphate isomerase
MAKKTQAKTVSANRDIKVAINVLETAIEGIRALELALDNRFIKAVDIIANLKGRVIISGMGKSGHIARKIAATLASTGTPAHFVHPGEASHGDLGMITKDDAVILLSNSGETAELKDIITYTKRFSIPLIGVVRRKTSSLVDAADIAFVLPEIPEASPLGAPTTSTTMMLVWGDAVAMALLERRGFGKDDFKVFHPGGKLGSKLTKVKDLMRAGKALPVVKASAPMSEALLEITSKRLGCTAVVDAKGKLIGIITDGDLRRHMGDNIIRQKAEKVMTAKPVCIRPNALAEEAVAVMNKKSITSLFVVEGDTLLGIIHIHDLLKAGAA